MPFASPVIVAVRAPLDHVAVAPPGLAVTEYPVIGDPPLDEEALHVTTACAFPAVAATFVGVVAGRGADVGGTGVGAGRGRSRRRLGC